MSSHLTFPLIAIFMTGTAYAQLTFAPPKEVSGESISGVSALDVADFNADALGFLLLVR